MPTIKERLKDVIPAFVLDWRRNRVEARIRDDLQHCVDAKDTFTRIYDRGYWGRSAEPGDRFFSGSGSHTGEIVDAYVRAVIGFLTSLPEKADVVDLGCGDFAVGSRIRPYCGRYMGCDVVEGLIARNRTKYADADVEFRVVDIINDALPDGDLVFLRQVLQHLSNVDVEQVVRKLEAKYRFLILSEHLPASADFVPNLDKPRGANIRIDIGDGSGLVLTEPPFHLRVKRATVLCEVRDDTIRYDGVIRTTLYEL